METNMYLEKLSDVRRGKGFTQEMLADISGVAVRTIQRIESGHKTSIETARNLSAALNVENYHALKSTNEKLALSSENIELIDSLESPISFEEYIKLRRPHELYFKIKHTLKVLYFPLILFWMVGNVLTWKTNFLVQDMTLKASLIDLALLFLPPLAFIGVLAVVKRVYFTPHEELMMDKGICQGSIETKVRRISHGNLQIDDLRLGYSEYVDSTKPLAKEGQRTAIACLGTMCLYGLFIPKNVNKGLYLLEIAAMNGCAYSAIRIAKQCKDTKSHYSNKTHSEWYELAQENGYV